MASTDSKPQDTLLAKLCQLSNRRDELADQLMDPEVLGDHRAVRDLSIRKAAIDPVADGYRAYEKDYGADYALQVVVEEPFVATTRVKDEATEEWGDAEVEVSGFAVVKPNTALKKLLAAEPIIDETNPATLNVLDHGEWNGYKTAKVSLKCSAFKQDDGSFDIDF
jgi:protein subunit release factor A